jgi:hypothetical protein
MKDFAYDIWQTVCKHNPQSVGMINAFLEDKGYFPSVFQFALEPYAASDPDHAAAYQPGQDRCITSL